MEMGNVGEVPISAAFLISFQKCHDMAIQALQALKLRAEYELLTSSLQVDTPFPPHTLAHVSCIYCTCLHVLTRRVHI